MFVKISEQPSLYNDLEKKSVREILEDINREDQKVALAVQKAIPQIEKLVTQIVPRMKQGGRIFYMGAGTSGRLGVLDASEIPPTFGMPPTLIIGLIAGGDTALRIICAKVRLSMMERWGKSSKCWKTIPICCRNFGKFVLGLPTSMPLTMILPS